MEGGAKGKGKAKGDPNWINLGLGMFSENSARDVALTSLLAGGASGAVVCVGSAPFELVKVGSLPLSFCLSRLVIRICGRMTYMS